MKGMVTASPNSCCLHNCHYFECLKLIKKNAVYRDDDVKKSRWKVGWFLDENVFKFCCKTLLFIDFSVNEINIVKWFYFIWVVWESWKKLKMNSDDRTIFWYTLPRLNSLLQWNNNFKITPAMNYNFIIWSY